MQSWRELEGSDLDGRVRLDRLTGTEPSPSFTARLPDHPDQPVAVRFLRQRPDDEQLFGRWMEASFLSHPNLIRCFGAGQYENGIGSFVYVILERADTTLSQILHERALTIEEVRDLGAQLASGLSHLHQQNLVCCGLDTSTSARSGGFWKIADYSQLRVAGDTYATETRRLLAGSAAVPPEAFEGIVSPAWDAWGLATVLAAAVAGPKDDRKTARRDFPEPIEAILKECLTPDRRHRRGVERIAELLREDLSDSAEPLPPLQTRFRIDPVPRKRRWPVVAASGAALAAGTILAALNSKYETAPPRPVPIAAAPKQAPDVPPAADNPKPVTGDQDRATGAQQQRSSDGAQIYSVLNGWISAARNRDADAQAGYYAPDVDAFYGARHVTRDWVKRNREQSLSQLGEIRQLDISNVHVRQDRPDHATATFDKSWDFGGGYSGKVKQQLELRKLDGGWQITSERDIHVYRLHSGRSHA
jgi:hypothetical protein